MKLRPQLQSLRSTAPSLPSSGVAYRTANHAHRTLQLCQAVGALARAQCFAGHKRSFRPPNRGTLNDAEQCRSAPRLRTPVRVMSDSGVFLRTGNTRSVPPVLGRAFNRSSAAARQQDSIMRRLALVRSTGITSQIQLPRSIWTKLLREPHRPAGRIRMANSKRVHKPFRLAQLVHE